jgi:excisionase family DNA binding protein
MTTPGLDRDDPLLRPLTIKQAMELTGRSNRTIDRWIQDGRLRKVKLGGDPPQEVLIEREVLEAERATRQASRRGRPRPKVGDTPPAADGVDAGS